MLLEYTIAQLDIGSMPQERAEKMGHLGYIQWLGSLPGKASYRAEAQRAYDLARPSIGSSPAIAVFCKLIQASLDRPLVPLTLQLPPRTRRGGARARR